ncbi:MAG: hypothetical protein HYY02_05435 [Chloroflexi bacterium]|nr:hypothetical protein [Chloroflexota bacterium]
MDLDTFLVEVYCIVDDVYRTQFAPLKPLVGRPGTLSDSEVLTLALLAQWQQWGSERAFLRYAQHHWRSYFPRFISQSAFNRRVRGLVGVLCRLLPAIAGVVRTLLGAPAYEVLDSVPVPLMRRCRGEKHRLFGPEAAIGYGGSDKDWYYGVSLLTVVDAHGLITGFVAGPANTEARWLAETLFRWRRDPTSPAPTADELAPVLPVPHRQPRQGPTGPLGPRGGAGAPGQVYLGDRGFRGAGWQRHWQDTYGVILLTGRGETLPWCPLGHLRQLVEQTFATLTNAFGLGRIRARHYWGLLTRLAAKLAAFNLGVYWNYLHGRSPGSVSASAW